MLVPQRRSAATRAATRTVMVVNADDKVELRASSGTAQSIGDKWLVTERPAAPGDRVIVEGLQKVRPGAPVQASGRGRCGSRARGTGRRGEVR